MAANPAHKVTEQTKDKVISLRSCGVTNEEIAKKLGISSDTLTRHYRYELDIAQIDANEAIARSLYNKALAGDVTAMIFWLKTRARWRSEDHKNLQDTTEEVAREIKELRAKLDAQYKRDY